MFYENNLDKKLTLYKMSFEDNQKWQVDFDWEWSGGYVMKNNTYFFVNANGKKKFPDQEEESLRVSSYRKSDNPSLNIEIDCYLQRDEDKTTYGMTLSFMDLCFCDLSDWKHQKYLQQQFKALSSKSEN